MKKEYVKEELVIIWQPENAFTQEFAQRPCQMFISPKKPWIRPENASIEELMAQIDACPSGALSYRKL